MLSLNFTAQNIWRREEEKKKKAYSVAPNFVYRRDGRRIKKKNTKLEHTHLSAENGDFVFFFCAFFLSFIRHTVRIYTQIQAKSNPKQMQKKR